MIVDALLTRWASGWSEVNRPDAIAVHGRREGFLSLGAVASRDEMTTIATQQLAVFGDPRTEIAADLVPVGNNDTPYVGFDMGDRILVPDLPGRSLSRERVKAITVAVDNDTGVVSYAPELRDPLLDERERFEDNLNKMTHGTLGGDSKVASPASYVSSIASIGTPAVAPAGIPTLVVGGYQVVAAGSSVFLSSFSTTSFLNGADQMFTIGSNTDADGNPMGTVTASSGLVVFVAHYAQWRYVANPGQMSSSIGFGTWGDQYDLGPFDTTGTTLGYSGDRMWWTGAYSHQLYRGSVQYLAAGGTAEVEWQTTFMVIGRYTPAGCA